MRETTYVLRLRRILARKDARDNVFSDFLQRANYLPYPTRFRRNDDNNAAGIARLGSGKKTDGKEERARNVAR